MYLNKRIRNFTVNLKWSRHFSGMHMNGHTPAAWHARNEPQYSSDRKLCGPQSQSGWCRGEGRMRGEERRGSLAPTRYQVSDSPVIQPVASSEWAMLDFSVRTLYVPHPPPFTQNVSDGNLVISRNTMRQNRPNFFLVFYYAVRSDGIHVW
jgi:hypothetical protein